MDSLDDFLEQDLEIMSTMMRNAGVTDEASESEKKPDQTRPQSSKNMRRNPPYCRATQAWPKFHLLALGEPVALDTEYQNYWDPVKKKWCERQGRPALVNTRFETVLDLYAVYNKEPGVEKRCPPPRFGVTPADLLYENGAVSAEKVERWIEQIVANRPVILHGGKGDKNAFYLRPNVLHNHPNVIDTQELYSNLQGDGTPSLELCAAKVLGRVIQKDGIHSPVEDAVATMQLYLQKFPFDRDAALARQAAATQQSAHTTSNKGNGGRGGRGGSRGGRGGRGRGRGRGN